MQYFKNVDLTKMYPVSEKAVRNWIAAAKEGKLELDLYEDRGRHYIANTSKNTAKIEAIVAERRKYVNSKSKTAVKPTNKFYQIYNKKQILDLVFYLETYREIPLKYTYFNGGAKYWDRYVHRLANENLPNVFSSFQILMDLNQDYIDELLKTAKKVNIIDIGPGNGMPVKSVIQDLLDKGVMGRYVAIDISQPMLDIVESNIKKWFQGKVSFEGYVRDIDYDRFNDLIAEDALLADENTINLVFLVGGTLYNFRSPDEFLKVVHKSMGKNDFFIHDLRPDSEIARRNFDFSAEGDTNSSSKGQEILNLLNIDPTCYEIEKLFDEERKMRLIRMRLKSALSITFEFENGSHTIDFNKGEVIMLWRHWHKSAFDALSRLDRSGFDILQTSRTKDGNHLLTISRIKTDIVG